ncbi:MAG: ATP-binding cassette domain-containing protein, partial [Proteobacteria bacterium]
MYVGYAQLIGQRQTLIDVLAMLPLDFTARGVRQSPIMPTPFRAALTFEGVGFRFAEKAPKVLHGVDLTIRKGERVGFIGRTGSGKSTLLKVSNVRGEAD